MSKIVDALREVIGLFEEHGLTYAVMGGLAVRAHAIPRPTWDIDFTLAIDRDQLVTLYDAFEDLGYSVDDAYRAGWVDTVAGMPLVKAKLFIGGETLPIDIFLAETPFQQTALSRRVRAIIFDLETWAISPEDMVLFKLTASRYRDLGDAMDILVMQGQLDVAYMRTWAARLGTDAKLEELLEQSGQVH
jgi:hypothetical protein